jgi:hypothetical protein
MPASTGQDRGRLVQRPRHDPAHDLHIAELLHLGRHRGLALVFGPVGVAAVRTPATRVTPPIRNGAGQRSPDVFDGGNPLSPSIETSLIPNL